MYYMSLMCPLVCSASDRNKIRNMANVGTVRIRHVHSLVSYIYIYIYGKGLIKGFGIKSQPKHVRTWKRRGLRGNDKNLSGGGRGRRGEAKVWVHFFCLPLSRPKTFFVYPQFIRSVTI